MIQQILSNASSASLDYHGSRFTEEGNNKGLRHLHDVVSQHLQALKAIDYGPSGQFITSFIEPKLDQALIFERQWHT